MAWTPPTAVWGVVVRPLLAKQSESR